MDEPFLRRGTTCVPRIRARRSRPSRLPGAHPRFQLISQLDEIDLLDDDNLSRLVDPFIEIQLMKFNGQRAADELGDGRSANALLVVDKINWSEFHVAFGRLAAELLQDNGIRRPTADGYQLTGLQRSLLESPGRRIARGTNQIQRNIIGERVLGLPK